MLQKFSVQFVLMADTAGGTQELNAASAGKFLFVWRSQSTWIVLKQLLWLQPQLSKANAGKTLQTPSIVLNINIFQN